MAKKENKEEDKNKGQVDCPLSKLLTLILKPAEGDTDNPPGDQQLH
ncbi:hypothetical protein N7V09_08375 [Shewanella seohaensis]|nr:hypothetical protein [Shewanella seohaensis]UXM83986.1 hypothetical protein N7V09_08375 [Shewanella seohaensis]